MKLQVEIFLFNINGLLNDAISDEAFFNFCQQNQNLKLERDHNKKILLKALSTFYTGAFNSAIATELNLWNRKLKMGKVFDSSTGFTLPDNAVFSPDAAWVSNEKMSLLTEKQKNKFAPICPNFVIELKS